VGLFGKKKRVEAPPEPEPEVVDAQDYAVRIAYGAKSSEGLRLPAGPNVLQSLPGILAGVALTPVEVVPPRTVEFAQAAPVLERPSEAFQWVSANSELGPIARHAVMVLETVEALDPAFDTLACALLGGELDTSGYPRFDAIVGGVAAHWDEATGDVIARGLVAWGGRGIRGDTDRVASRVLSAIVTSLRAAAEAGPVVIEEASVPARAGGGLVCPSCGFAAGRERAFYCPKCGMRLLRA
jgi:hypothetical protein